MRDAIKMRSKDGAWEDQKVSVVPLWGLGSIPNLSSSIKPVCRERNGLVSYSVTDVVDT